MGKRKLMHPEFSQVFHRKLGQVYFSIHYRMNASETEFAAFVSQEFVTAGVLDHGAGLSEPEIQEALLVHLQTLHGYKKYLAYLIEKLQNEYYAEENERMQKIKRQTHKLEMLQKKSSKVSPYYEVKIPGMILPAGAYGLNQPAANVLLKRGTKLLVADGAGIRFYDNCPLPPLPVKKSPVELGEVVVHAGKWKLGALINFMPQIRDLMGDQELRVTDLVPKVTVIVPVVLPVREDENQVENKARKFLKCPEPQEDIKDADIFDVDQKRREVQEADGLTEDQIRALIEEDRDLAA